MYNSKFRRTYLLRQHTPLLHFQPDQPHAALRASEVKPMLDRFMQKFVEKHNLNIPKDWYIQIPEGNSYAKPFNYKMSIKTDGAPVQSAPHKLYFGGIGGNSSVKALTFKCKDSSGKIIDGVKLETICFCETTAKKSDSLANCGLPDDFTLNDFMSFVIPAFFALTCFGTRATKGFGSFTLSGKRIDAGYLHYFVPVFYSISYGMAIPSAEKVLDDIWVISGLMKSGFNLGRDYYKGRIFRYFKERYQQEIGGDKAFIKRSVLTNGEDFRKNGSEDYVQYKNFRFVRAMLGLPQGYRFRKNPNTTTREGAVKISAGKGNKVARFASPVRFVPNGGILYIIPEDIPAEMYNAQFNFTSQVQSATIATPSEKEFNLVEYLDWFSNEFNTQKDLANFRNPAVRVTLDKRLRIEKSKAGEKR